MAKPLSFKDMLPDGLLSAGEDEFIKYRRRKQKRTACEQTEEPQSEALNMQQRRARARLMKRIKSKIKLGRDRARRKMATPDKLKKRAQKQARMKIFLKISKGVREDDMSFVRRAEIEKRLDKPQVKKRIDMLAKKMLKDVRKKEVERKKG